MKILPENYQFQKRLQLGYFFGENLNHENGENGGNFPE